MFIILEWIGSSEARDLFTPRRRLLSASSRDQFVILCQHLFEALMGKVSVWMGTICMSASVYESVGGTSMW